MSKMDTILSMYQDVEFMIPDGFDNACIGVEEREYRLIYSVSKTVEILINEYSIPPEDVMEYLDMNIVNVYVGEHTPIWCYDIYDEEE